MNLGPLIAEHVEREPRCLEQALLTLDRWAREGIIPPGRAAAWRDILGAAQSGAEGMRALLALLRDDSEAARRLKDFSPFAGILPREVRRKAFLSCSYDH